MAHRVDEPVIKVTGGSGQQPTADGILEQKLPCLSRQTDLRLEPDNALWDDRASGKLCGQVALVIGGNPGTRRARRWPWMEDIEVVILDSKHDDEANATRAMADAPGRRSLAIRVDVSEVARYRTAVERMVGELGDLHVLVNNAAYQMAQPRFEDVTEESFQRTFETNSFAYFQSR